MLSQRTFYLFLEIFQIPIQSKGHQTELRGVEKGIKKTDSAATTNISLPRI